MSVAWWRAAFDDKNNKISSAAVWVSSESMSWRQDNNDRISLVADKKEYAPAKW